VAAGTSGEAAAACWAEVLAAESAAFENLVVALENWVAASEMDDVTLHWWVNHLWCSEERARLW
jgi:hypothetical protein